jgi:hypothetical protein
MVCALIEFPRSISIAMKRIRSMPAMAALEGQFVENAKGKKTGIILPLKRYQKLMEDLHDLEVVAERRSEEPVAFEEMKRRLKKDGIRDICRGL